MMVALKYKKRCHYACYERRDDMQYLVIWALLIIFCLIPPVVAQILIKNEEKYEKQYMEFYDRKGGKKV